MPAGQSYGCERRFMTDEKTGVRITQLTSFPAVRETTNYAFTPDGRTVIFLEKLTLDRFAPFALFKCDTDGRGYTCLADGAFGGMFVSRSSRELLYTARGRFIRMDLDTLREREICALPDEVGADMLGPAGMSLDGETYVANTCRPMKNGRWGFVRMKTDGSESSVALETDEGIVCSHLEPAGGDIVAYHTEPDEKGRNIRWASLSHGTFAPMNLYNGNGHWMWMGISGSIVSCYAKDGAKTLVTCAPGDERETLLSGEHAYWHCAASTDGRFVVSDTNWPDTGIQIVSSKTGRAATVCLPHSTSCHPQWTHTHPFTNADGSIIVYKTDVCGYPNVCLAFVPPEMREGIEK